MQGFHEISEFRIPPEIPSKFRSVFRRNHMTELRNSVPYSVHFLQAEFRNFAEMTWQAEFRVFRNDGIPLENLINDYIFGLTIVFFIQFSKISLI